MEFSVQNDLQIQLFRIEFNIKFTPLMYFINHLQSKYYVCNQLQKKWKCLKVSIRRYNALFVFEFATHYYLTDTLVVSPSVGRGPAVVHVLPVDMLEVRVPLDLVDAIFARAQAL